MTVLIFFVMLIPILLIFMFPAMVIVYGIANGIHKLVTGREFERMEKIREEKRRKKEARKRPVR